MSKTANKCIHYHSWECNVIGHIFDLEFVTDLCVAVLSESRNHKILSVSACPYICMCGYSYEIFKLNQDSKRWSNLKNVQFLFSKDPLVGIVIFSKFYLTRFANHSNIIFQFEKYWKYPRLINYGTVFLELKFERNKSLRFNNSIH